MNNTELTSSAIDKKIAEDKRYAPYIKKLKKAKRKKKKKMRKLESTIWDLKDQLDNDAEKIKHLKKKSKRYKRNLRRLLYHYGDNPFISLDDLPHNKHHSDLADIFQLPPKKKN